MSHQPSGLRSRKLRKGTWSCHQCKRRKTKCMFLTPGEACIGCRSRKVDCFSQGYIDPFDNNDSAVSELSHVSDPSASHACTGQISSSLIATPDGNLLCKPSFGPLGKAFTLTDDSISSAWPSPHDLEVIKAATLLDVGNLVQHVPTFRARLGLSNTIASQTALSLPPAGSHPILYAQAFLALAIVLQNLGRAFDRRASLDVRRHDLMKQAIDAGHRLINTHDVIVECVEGIECYMLESIFYRHAGNLRRAYLTVRRAITLGQVLGLHRGASARSIYQTPDGGMSKDSRHLWFRLVQLDRYLSLMLGLPQATTDDSFASDVNLEKCAPLERMERLQCVATGRILQLNDRDMYDKHAIQDIEMLLVKASSQVRPTWWLSPQFSRNLLEDTTRMMEQLPHYFLLIQLHLPYLLRTSVDCGMEQSRNTATAAARDILSRYVSFRGCVPVETVYCRGLDYLVFAACAVLCLVHIDDRRIFLSRSQRGTTNRTDVNSPAHSRQSDRGLMEQSLTSMEDRLTSHDDEHETLTKVVYTLRRLMDIEADAFNGAIYTTTATVTNDDHATECSGRLNDSSDGLCIAIPYFGEISIDQVVAPSPSLSRDLLFGAFTTAVDPAVSSATDHTNHLTSDDLTALENYFDFTVDDSLQGIDMVGDSDPWEFLNQM